MRTTIHFHHQPSRPVISLDSSLHPIRRRAPAVPRPSTHLGLTQVRACSIERGRIGKHACAHTGNAHTHTHESARTCCHRASAAAALASLGSWRAMWSKHTCNKGCACTHCLLDCTRIWTIAAHRGAQRTHPRVCCARVHPSAPRLDGHSQQGQAACTSTAPPPPHTHNSHVHPPARPRPLRGLSTAPPPHTHTQLPRAPTSSPPSSAGHAPMASEGTSGRAASAAARTGAVGQATPLAAARMSGREVQPMASCFSSGCTRSLRVHARAHVCVECVRVCVVCACYTHHHAHHACHARHAFVAGIERRRGV